MILKLGRVFSLGLLLWLVFLQAPAALAEGESDPLWDRPNFEKKVFSIGQRILAANRVTEHIPFLVERSGDINAYAARGLHQPNMVVVANGLLRYIERDDELAAVLSHEIAHILCRHGRKVFIKRGIVRGLAAGIVALATYDPYTGKSSEKALNESKAYSDAATRRFSQPYEREADLLGIDMMVRAGYNPLAAETMMNKLSGDAGRVTRFFAEHPQGQERLDRMRAHIQANYPQFLTPEAARNIPGALYPVQTVGPADPDPKHPVVTGPEVVRQAAADLEAAIPSPPKPASLPLKPPDDRINTLAVSEKAGSSPSPAPASSEDASVAQLFLTLNANELRILRWLSQEQFADNADLVEEFADMPSETREALLTGLERKRLIRILGHPPDAAYVLTDWVAAELNPHTDFNQK